MSKRARTGTAAADDAATPAVERLSYAEELHGAGVVVVPLGEDMISGMPDIRADMKRIAFTAPEFEGATVSEPVCGSFQALAHPSTFHAEEVRVLRQRCMAQLVNHLWRDFVAADGPGSDDLRLEQMFDRLCVRRAGTTITGETWHRDVSPNTLDSTDRVFGGWLNIGPKVQYFKYVPGTQASKGASSGFVRAFSASDKRCFTARSVTVEVPVGHMVVFFENIVHGVAGRHHEEDEYRLFLGWRLTSDDFSANGGNDGEDLRTALTTQAVMALKSGQRVPMWPKMFQVYHAPKLASFSEQLPASMRGADGRATRFLPSLTKLGVDTYDAYTKEEIGMYMPNTTWMLHGGDAPGLVQVSLYS